MRPILRSHFYPHLFFLTLLVLVGAAGILRVYHHVELLTASQTELTTALADRARLQTLHQGVVNAWQLWEVQRPDEALSADFRRAFLDLRYHAQRRLHLGSSLSGDVDYHQFQLLIESTQQQIARRAISPAGGGAPRFSHLLMLWNRLDSRVTAAMNRHVATLLSSRQSLLLEATLTFVLIVSVALIYLLSVNRYLAGPIDAVAEAARRVTRGDLEARAEPPPGGPVASLAIDLNRMIDILLDSLAEEERVVRELQLKTRQLEQANEHKSRFLANISHELKTPLNAIIGFADILDAGPHGEVNERQREYLRRIGSAGGHLLAMISDLIDIARIDVGAIALTPAPIEPGELAREVSELLLPQAQKKGHDLRLDLPEELAPIVADRQRLKQILINLTSNAIKFTPEQGQISLMIRLSDSHIAFAVSDTGIGIPAEHREAIFDDFVQLDSRLHRQHEGTGIGLALSRRLAELMGGSLSVESTVGSGSTFILTLPRGG